MKIIITQDLRLSEKQVKRLERIGDIKIYKELSKTPEEWFERCEDADIVCTGKFGLKTEKLYELEDKFISVPFVGTDFLDLARLKKRNITVARSPGCNKIAVSEWILGMIFNLLREFPKYINNKDLSKGEIPPPAIGLAGHKIAILGKGHVGSRVGELCQAIDMTVNYFDKGDNLKESITDADIIVNTLSSNPTTENLLNKNFFSSLKKGTFFITATSSKIYDVDAMLEALDKGILAGAADDSASIQVGDTDDPS